MEEGHLVGKQVCSNGHQWKTRFHPAPSELRCPEPGCDLPAEPTLKARSTALGDSAAEPKALAEAHARFSALVTEWPCFFADPVEGNRRRPDHNCWGPKDPHHLIPARFIKAHYGDLTDPELADILYAPIIGVPLCRAAHDAVERHSDYVYWHELDPELIAQCQEWEQRYPDRKSLLEQLRLESPVKEATRA